MATVNVPWTGFSPTMSSNGGATPGISGSLNDGESAIARKVAQLLRKPQFRPMRRLLRVLDGNNVGAGGNAVENKTQVKAVQVLNTPLGQGGQVVIETIPLLGATVAGRVTATADQTRLNAMIDEIVYPATYPTDPSGNGGGGKVGR